MIQLPTAYTARNNAISNAPIPEALQTTISNAIAFGVGQGEFSVTVPLDKDSVQYEDLLTSWLKSLGYVVDYTAQPYETGQIDITWG